MDLTLTQEQRLIVDTVRAFAEKELYPHEDEVERLDQVPPGLAGQIRAAHAALPVPSYVGRVMAIPGDG